MGRNFATQIKEIKEREFTAGMLQGMEFCKIISVLALNNIFGFGAKRLDQYEAEVDRLLKEEVHGKEPELLRAELERALSQIGGNK